MPHGTLLIGQRRYSSWSLRGWLAVRIAGLDVNVELVRFTRPGPTAEIQRRSPNGLVPYLEHDGARVWELLAIVEYCADLYPALWPGDRVARATARSIAAEMHGGFQGLRASMCMNLGRDFAGKGRTPQALHDIARIETMWREVRAAHSADGPYLFGAAFTGADVMFAPVVTRFFTWKPEISDATKAYCDAVRRHPLMQEWYEAASHEPGSWCIAEYENA